MAVGFAASPWWNGWTSGSRGPSIREQSREWRHYWVGHRDGSHCLPVLDHGASAPPAHLQQIATSCASVLERRWTDLLLHTKDDRLALSRLLPELARAEARRDLARLALAEHLTTKPGEARRFGEEHLPLDLVRRRRQREHESATQAVTADRDRTRNYVTQLVQQRRELESRISLQLELAQSEAREQHRLYTRSASSYLRGAQRTHHDPDGLIRQYATYALPLPAWASLDGLPAFLRASGAERAM